MAIRKVANAYYVVRDMDRSARFYRDVLGLEVKFADPGKWTQFDVAGTQIAIATPAPGQPDPGENATVVLEVDDLDAMQQRLRDEYSVECSFEPVTVHTARWVQAPDDKSLDKFKNANQQRLALDHGGYLVYLASSRVNLQMAEERYPEITFSDTREQRFAAD